MTDVPGFKPLRWPFLGGQTDQTAIPLNAFALALDNSRDGLLIADMRLRGQPIVHVNSAFEAITGYSAAEAIGKNCRYLQGGDRLQPEIAEVRAALAEQRTCSVVLRNYRWDGTMFHNALRLLPLRDEAGQVTHFIGLIRDVTHAAGIDHLTALLDRYGPLDRLAATRPIDRVRLHILGRPRADLNLASLARVAGISPRHLSRLFHAELGMSAAAYVELARVDVARRLLEDGGSSIKVAAYAAGFGSTATLRRAFLRVIGITPLQYRRRFHATGEVADDASGADLS